MMRLEGYRCKRLFAAGALAILSGGSSFGADESPPGGLALDTTPAEFSGSGGGEEARATSVERFVADKAYGTQDTEWVTFGGGGAHDFDDNTDLNLHVAWSRFLVDDVEFMLEAGAWWHAQDGDDAASLNPVMEFRWHFFNNGRTTLFLNAGIGLLFASDSVPDGGTSLDFTPRAGAGLTHALGNSGNRLVAGVRWHHISNARFSGEDRNPSRDAPMIYAGVAFPF